MTHISNPADALKADFKQAMRRLAASVHVIATRGDDHNRYGLTATAVSSLSMEPPLLLVCVNQSAESHQALAKVGHGFSVNLLTPGQSDVSQRFGTPALRGEARFAEADWNDDANGVPVLGGAAYSLSCVVEALHPHGTHSIIVGRVVGVTLGERPEALLYAAGGYTEAATRPD